MVLSRGWRKQRGGKDGAHHFHHVHLHYHPPRRVCPFSPLWSLLPRFSLLSLVLIPPVLFFGVLTFVVSYVWLTSFYFVASLLNKDSKLESSKDSGGTRRASNADRCRREDDCQERNAKAKAVKHVAELLTGDSAADGVFAEMLEIKEVHVDEFSEVSRNISGTTASSDACLHCEVRTKDYELVETVVILETSREEIDANADLDDFSERHRVHEDMPIDRFLEELNIGEVSTSGHAFPTVLPINSAENKQIMVVPSINSSHHYVGDKHEEFVDDRKELSACSSSEICEFIDKHETREQVLTPSDGSAHRGIRDVQKTENTEEKDASSLLEFLVDREDFDEQQEIQKVVVHDNSKLPEVRIIEANKKQSVGASDEVHDFTELNETSRLSLDSLCEDSIGTAASSDARSNHHIADEDDKKKELTTNTIEEASDTASIVCEFGDEREKINENCTSKGVPPCRLPLVRGAPAPWWNLCGVLDAFGGCED